MRYPNPGKSKMGHRSRANFDGPQPAIAKLPRLFRLQVRKWLGRFNIRTDWFMPICDGVTIDVEWPAWPSTDCYELPKYEITFSQKEMINQCLQPVVLEKHYVYRQCCPACMRAERSRVDDDACPDVIIQIKPIDDRFDAFA